jgi:hypothetical protein
MADWYTKTVLTVIAVCLSFLAGREALAPSRNYETLKIVSGLSDVSRSVAGLDYETSKIVTGLSDLGQSSSGLDKTNLIQKVRRLSAPGCGRTEEVRSGARPSNALQWPELH